MTDDLEIPTFLRRTERLTDDQLRRLTNPLQRDWVMPTKPIEENDMAKADFRIENRAAPVFVYRYTNDGPVKVREFPSADDFEQWYQPRKMRSLGATARPEFTDVLLDMPDPGPEAPMPLKAPGTPRGAPSAPAATSGPARPVSTSGTTSTGRRGAYMDSRHIAKLEAAGFKRVQEHPMAFQRGKDRVDVAPPTDGKWSSSWTLNGQQQGRGISTLMRALGD